MTPTYYNPYYRDPQKVPPILGNSYIGAPKGGREETKALQLHMHHNGLPMKVLKHPR